VVEVKTLWFTKGRRAQNEEDYETWIEGGVMPTLNAFDNGDIRTTVIIFYGNRVDDVRLQGGVINTLQARMGTGGNNMPMLMRMREGKPGGGKGPLISDDKSLTIATANDQTLLNEGTVRRLTPVECERLQGFPDDWTAGQSDSARYKQMGNAVAVPVVEWLIQNIVDVANVS
jgi:site-specific DNA-cytosine methylase